MIKKGLLIIAMLLAVPIANAQTCTTKLYECPEIPHLLLRGICLVTNLIVCNKISVLLYMLAAIFIGIILLFWKMFIR